MSVLKSELHHFPGQVLNLEHPNICSGDARLNFKIISVLAQTKFTGAKTESVPMGNRNSFFLPDTHQVILVLWHYKPELKRRSFL